MSNYILNIEYNILNTEYNKSFYKSFEYEQPTIELPLEDFIINEKKEKNIIKKRISDSEEFPLVPDANDEFDITDKFDINKKNTFQM